MSLSGAQRSRFCTPYASLSWDSVERLKIGGERCIKAPEIFFNGGVFVHVMRGEGLQRFQAEKGKIDVRRGEQLIGRSSGK